MRLPLVREGQWLSPETEVTVLLRQALGGVVGTFVLLVFYLFYWVFLFLFLFIILNKGAVGGRFKLHL